MKTQIVVICVAAVFLQASAFVRREAPAPVDDLIKSTKEAVEALAKVTKDNVSNFLNVTNVQDSFKEIQKKIDDATDPDVKKNFEEASEKIKQFINENFNEKTVDKLKTDFNDVVKSVTSATEAVGPKLKDAGNSISDVLKQIAESVKSTADSLKKE